MNTRLHFITSFAAIALLTMGCNRGGPVAELAPDRFYQTQPPGTIESRHVLADRPGVLYNDVYDDKYNFLYGQARIAGPVCVASANRMGGKLKDAAKSPQQRWISIVRHELGHTLGLQHVDDRKSVMAFGATLSELDGQGDTLTKADWQRLDELHPIRWER